MPSAKLSPAMEQYMGFKRQHRDSILFFRMGDFYEMFYEDAKVASRALGLTLTSRNHGKTSGDIPLAGVPHHAMETYVARLIQMGHKVAICEQVEDPKKAKGIVKRDVVQVVSPGTALADSMLDQQRNNFLAGLCPGKDQVGIALVDLSTGDFSLDEVPTAQLGDELERLGPAELLLGERADEQWVEDLKRLLPQVAVSRVEDWHFERDQAYEQLTDQFKVRSLKGFDCDDLDLGIRAGGACVAYLRDTQRGAIDHVNRVVRRRRGQFLLLDGAAQRNLELLANQQDGAKEGSLLAVLDRTLTPMGARLLRLWVVAPLKQVDAVEERLQAVASLVENAEALEGVRQQLRHVGDLERMMARICCQRANPRDLVGLAQSLRLGPDVAQLVGPLPSPLLERLVGEELPDTAPLIERISEALVDAPPATITDGGMIRDGYDSQVDELRQISSGGKDWIAQMQIRERERTGITSLKVGFNQVFGYYIEVSKANLSRVPEEYIRKQTLANAERYITPQLKEYESKVLGAEERLKELEKGLFVELRDWIIQWARPVQQSARTLATIDTLATLAEVARTEGYIRPQIDAGTRLEIKGGRHPVVERQLQEGRFVPNDVALDSAAGQVLLITGPNMAGKSTIIRQVGLIVLLAQMGSFVPARRAQIGVVDRIFTRVGASDNLARGESTFMVEMNEAANILNNATERSLILMDELGRGTSTFDGLSIAWAIVEYLHGGGARPRTLFSTHYHEMTELADKLERVENFNVQVREEGGHIAFLHRLAPGPCDRSYGINVAQMAGMPTPVVERAKELLARLEGEQIDAGQLSAELGPAPAAAEQAVEPEAPPAEKEGTVPQLDLFGHAAGAPFAEELMRLDLSQVTPLQALLKLNEWRESLLGDHPSGNA